MIIAYYDGGKVNSETLICHGLVDVTLSRKG